MCRKFPRSILQSVKRRIFSFPSFLPTNILLNNDLHSSRKLNKTPEYIKPRILPVTAGTRLKSHQANGLTDLQALKIVADTYLFEKEKSGIGIKIGENQALTLSLPPFKTRARGNSRDFSSASNSLKNSKSSNNQILKMQDEKLKGNNFVRRGSLGAYRMFRVTRCQ